MQLQQAREKFVQLQSKLSAYNHAMSLIFYDGATTAPKGTAANRGHTLSILSEESYKLSTGEEAAQSRRALEKKVKAAGYNVVTAIGNVKR